MRSTRPRRAEITITFSNDLGIAIATPIRKALFGPHAPRAVIVKRPPRKHPDGEDEEGQASSTLAVSTRWISTAKLLQSDLATLTQREGGE
ncbi:hypothetical protein BHM03_00052043 [Ensete ventricosum]|nr:hypothetical protein BHM03_00052043 [Ensete ventricosum]